MPSQAWDSDSGVSHLTYSSLEIISLYSRIQKSLFFGLQTLSFPLQNDFPWAKPVSIVTVNLNLQMFQLSFTVPLQLFTATHTAMVAWAMMFNVIA